jgi:hypothetical protein
MSSRASLVALYGTSGSSFADNTTRLITEAILRAFGQGVLDSHFNLTDDALTGAQAVKPGITSIATLQAVTTVGVAVGVHMVFRDTAASNVLRVYELVAGTDAESSPSIIRPTDYNGSTNAKVWKLAIIAAGLDSTTIVTNSGATLYIDMNNDVDRILVGYPAIAEAKTWDITNDTNALRFTFIFNLAGVYVQTMPSNFIMSDARFSAGDWTPLDAGKYIARGEFNSQSLEWYVTIEGPFSLTIT